MQRSGLNCRLARRVSLQFRGYDFSRKSRQARLKPDHRIGFIRANNAHVYLPDFPIARERIRKVRKSAGPFSGGAFFALGRDVRDDNGRKGMRDERARPACPFVRTPSRGRLHAARNKRPVILVNRARRVPLRHTTLSVTKRRGGQISAPIPRHESGKRASDFRRALLDQ